MDFLYDMFFEVLSEEGIWVLILIASAFAVASFILLTLRVETSPRQAVVGEMDKNPQKEKRPKGEKKRKKQKETAPEVEGGASEPKTDLPLDPQMTPPESFTHPEVVLPGSAPYKNIPLPVGEEPPALAAPPASGLVLDPFEVASIPGPDVAMPVADVASISASMAEKATPADKGPIVVPIDGVTTSTGMAPEQAEDDEESEPSQESENTDIFDLFAGVDEEDTELTEFAKELDDVAVSGLLTETEDLSLELKDILTKHGRRQ
ncbi:MAG: hypothetical protein KAT75_09305 [Dehalococcoidia bacterium]|nr:hypothetical protein [Dehalococcoidia bacterium]